MHLPGRLRLAMRHALGLLVSLGAAVGLFPGASWIPARRAARIDPATVLREE